MEIVESLKLKGGFQLVRTEPEPNPEPKTIPKTEYEFWTQQDRIKGYVIKPELQTAIKNVIAGTPQKLVYQVSFPRPGGKVISNMQVTKKKDGVCIIGPDGNLEFETKMLEREIIDFASGAYYSREQIQSTFFKCFSEWKKTIEHDLPGLTIDAVLVDNDNFYETKQRIITYNNTAQVGVDGVGDISIFMSNLPDYHPQSCKRQGNLLALQYPNWANKIGKFSNLGNSIEFDIKDLVFDDSDPRLLQNQMAYSLNSTMHHEIGHFLGLTHAKSAKSVMYAVIPTQKKISQILPYGIMGDFGARIGLAIAYGYLDKLKLS